MSDVVKSNGGAVAPQDQRNFFEIYGDTMTPTVITGLLLRFTKFGEYKSGKDESVIPLGTQLIVHMPSLRAGWIKWVDNKPVEQRMGLIAEGFVADIRKQLDATDEDEWDEFPDGRKRDPWQFTNQVIMVDPDSEQLYTFSTPSKGGLGAIGELAKAYGKHMRIDPSKMPLIALEMREYQHSNPAYGKIRAPEFKVLDWVDCPDDLLSTDNEQEEIEETKPAKAVPKPKAEVRDTMYGKATPTKAPPPKGKGSKRGNLRLG